MRFVAWLSLVFYFPFLHTSPVQGQDNRVTSNRGLSVLLTDLQDDDRHWNCARAMQCLYENRDSLARELRSSIPSLDWQGQLAIASILCECDSFEPDDDFLRLIVDQIRGGTTLNIDAYYKTRYDLVLYLQEYGEEHPEKVTTLLEPEIGKGDLQFLWMVTYVLDAIGTLGETMDCFTPQLLESVTSNLRDDDVPYNATFAIRLCLMLGDKILPYLVAEAERGDLQSRRLSRPLTRAIEEGDKKALEGTIRFSCPLESGLLNRGIRRLPKILPRLQTGS